MKKDQDASIFPQIPSKEEIIATHAALQQELTQLNLDCLLVMGSNPDDEHMLPSLQYIAELTGFYTLTSEAALAAIPADKSKKPAVFVNSLYAEQAKAEVPEDILDPLPAWSRKSDGKEYNLIAWLRTRFPKGAQVGYDPRLHGATWMNFLIPELEKYGITLVPVEDKPMNRVWKNRPDSPWAPVTVHPLEYAGESPAEKIERVLKYVAVQAQAANAADKKEAQDKGQDLKTVQEIDVVATVITQPSSIAWLLNIRGEDALYAPTSFCKAILHKNGSVELFIDETKLSPEVRAHLEAQKVTVYKPSELENRFGQFKENPGHVLVDYLDTPHFIDGSLRSAGANVLRRWGESKDPCKELKKVKNKTELQGTQEAHKRDSLVFTRLLHWIEERIKGNKKLDELEIEGKLKEFRKKDPRYRGESFRANVGSGTRPHYRSSAKTNTAIDNHLTLLLDVGAHYVDGTTDMTRTIPVKEPTPRIREVYTRVLQSHIRMATSQFVEGAKLEDLNKEAWKVLVEHGIIEKDGEPHPMSHGVGVYSAVHEELETLQPGNVLSNEPGFYSVKEKFGLRLENLVKVKESKNSPGQLEFEELTLVPFDRRLIDVSLLSSAEKDWIDTYHQRVRNELSPLLSAEPELQSWLQNATFSLGDRSPTSDYRVGETARVKTGIPSP